MAVQKNTNDLLSQAASTLPNNTTQQISPQDIREMAENTAFSSYNKLTDSPLVGLKQYSTLIAYESGQGCVYSGKVYISNQITVVGAFNAAHWDLYDNLTTAQKAKLDFISITQNVDLDAIEMAINNVTNPYLNKGLWDASTGVFPGGGTAQNGWTYICSVSGTVDGIQFTANQDKITALVNNASTTTYSTNWFKTDGSDLVTSVNGGTGAITVQPTLVSGTNIKTVNSQTVLGSGNLDVRGDFRAVGAYNAKNVIQNKPILFPAINFVDGNAVPPAAFTNDIYVLVDLGNGTVNAGWDGANYNDWVINDGAVWQGQSPTNGATCYDKTALVNKRFNGATWIDASGGVSDGDKVDITVSSSGTVWTIDNNAVTFAKIQNIATQKILGRETAGSGNVEELSISGDLQILLGVLGLNTTPMYISDVTTVNLLDNTANWTAANYTGAAITGTFQGQKHVNSTYFFECTHDNIWIRILRS
jgi:hypothetical protein